MTDMQKVAIITGASQGIGAGLASAFRAAGYAVVATALTMEPSEEAGLLTVVGDIADPATAETVVSSALSEFGRIDTLVNNAGVFIGKPFAEYTTEDYSTMVAVNLTGFFHITQRAIGHMKSQKTGHVVNISTSLVEHARTSSPAALGALTKGGLNAVTRALAIEYAAQNVRVNTVELGVIETPAHPREEYAGLAETHPLGRMGRIADVVAGVLYLERASFVTGETLHIDGGQAAGG
jgi:NAD(P)-dependent dehydrogenase (short-subunit alcohol dehydrogenase family)